MGDVYTALDWVGALLIAGALAMIAFAHKELKAARLMLLAGAGLTIMRWIIWSFTTDAPWPWRAFLGAIFGALILAAVPALWHWSIERSHATDTPNTMPAAVAKPPQTLTLETLFKNDFHDKYEVEESFGYPLQFNDDGEVQLSSIVFQDYKAKSFFMSFYIPQVGPDKSTDVMKYIGLHLNDFIQNAMKNGEIGLPLGSEKNVRSDLQFSKRIYIYHEDEMPVQQKALIVTAFTSIDVDAVLRGQDYFLINKGRIH
jgi:hypothetical protein